MVGNKIFISYRRNDLGGYSNLVVGQMYDHLSSLIGAENVFFDVDSIPPGIDFRIYLGDYLRRTDVLLAVIGDQWTDILLEKSNDNSDDFVRFEISCALERNITVVPVLIHGAKMPEAHELPAELKALAHLNAVKVDTGRRFRQGIESLVKSLDGQFTNSNLHASSSKVTPPPQLGSIWDDLAKLFPQDANTVLWTEGGDSRESWQIESFGNMVHLKIFNHYWEPHRPSSYWKAVYNLEFADVDFSKSVITEAPAPEGPRVWKLDITTHDRDVNGDILEGLDAAGIRTDKVSLIAPTRSDAQKGLGLLMELADLLTP